MTPGFKYLLVRKLNTKWMRPYMRRRYSGRRGQASKCRCSPSFSAPCSSLWVAGVLGLDFRGTLRFIGGSGPPRSNSGRFRSDGGSHRRCPSATQHVTPPAAVPTRDNADDGREGKDEQPPLPSITGGTLWRNLSLRLHMIRARSREAFYNGASTVEHGLTVLRFQANRRRQRIGEGG